MASFRETATISVEIHMTLTENEARLLTKLAGYGNSQLLRALEDNVTGTLGSNHAQALSTLMTGAFHGLKPILSRLDAARDTFARSA